MIRTAWGLSLACNANVHMVALRAPTSEPAHTSARRSRVVRVLLLAGRPACDQRTACTCRSASWRPSCTSRSRQIPKLRSFCA